MLNGEILVLLLRLAWNHTKSLAYNAFTRYGRSSSWCKAHALSFRAMSRAVSIRSQLKKYMQRFKIPLESCEGDAKRLRKCLVTGYWRNVARWTADGTYRAVRGDTVSPQCVTGGRFAQFHWDFCRYSTSIPTRFCSHGSRVLNG